MRQILTDLVGLIGLGALAEGVRQIHPPAALIVAGIVLIAWAALASRKVRA